MPLRYSRAVPFLLVRKDEVVAHHMISAPRIHDEIVLLEWSYSTTTEGTCPPPRALLCEMFRLPTLETQLPFYSWPICFVRPTAPSTRLLTVTSGFAVFWQMALLTVNIAADIWHSFLLPRSLNGYVTVPSPVSKSCLFRGIVISHPSSQRWKRLNCLKALLFHKIHIDIRQPIITKVLNIVPLIVSSRSINRVTSSWLRTQWASPFFKTLLKQLLLLRPVYVYRSLCISKLCCSTPEQNGTTKYFGRLSSAGSTLLAPTCCYCMLLADQS